MFLVRGCHSTHWSLSLDGCLHGLQFLFLKASPCLAFSTEPARSFSSPMSLRPRWTLGWYGLSAGWLPLREAGANLDMPPSRLGSMCMSKQFVALAVPGFVVHAWVGHITSTCKWVVSHSIAFKIPHSAQKETPPRAHALQPSGFRAGGAVHSLGRLWRLWGARQAGLTRVGAAGFGLRSQPMPSTGQPRKCLCVLLSLNASVFCAWRFAGLQWGSTAVLAKTREVCIP